MSEQYVGRQIVGMDLHRRRSVLVRMTETGERLETVRISNDPEYLRAAMARAGDVACQRDGTTALPRPRDHLGVDVMVIGSPPRVNQDTPVAAGWRVWPGRCRRR